MFVNSILLGYFAILLPPAVLVGSIQYGHPWATFACFVLASPITRLVFGVYRPRPLETSERASSILFGLPALHLVVLATCLPIAAFQLGAEKVTGSPGLTGFTFSLWTTMIFGTFPAHEMLHRRSRTSAIAGSTAAGMCGYPILGLEHAAHHARPGDSHHPEWPRADESVWSFAWRRLPDAIASAVHGDSGMRISGAWPPLVRPLTAGVFGTLLSAAAFFALSGTRGLVLYCCAALSVFLSMQIMTYVQHWGLGEDSVADAAGRELAWEDDCLMQAWITLNSSFHMAHHREAEAPYYFIQPSSDAPRQPGCYVVMLVACLCPAVWRRFMVPVLDAFANSRSLVCEPGRRVLCFKPSRSLPHRSALPIHDLTREQ